ncbi:hypothetical protein Hanom_Chr01g00050691 [Helianthus anomalus]
MPNPLVLDFNDEFLIRWIGRNGWAIEAETIELHRLLIAFIKGLYYSKKRN